MVPDQVTPAHTTITFTLMTMVLELSSPGLQCTIFNFPNFCRVRKARFIPNNDRKMKHTHVLYPSTCACGQQYTKWKTQKHRQTHTFKKKTYILYPDTSACGQQYTNETHTCPALVHVDSNRQNENTHMCAVPKHLWMFTTIGKALVNVQHTHVLYGWIPTLVYVYTCCTSRFCSEAVHSVPMCDRSTACNPHWHIRSR